MQNNDPQHLSDEELTQFQDGELPERYADHIASCPYCDSRLRDLRAARSAYAHYWHTIRKPRLPRPPRDWEPLGLLIARHQARQRGRNLRLGILLSLAATLCVIAVVIFYERTQSPSLKMNELLARSEKAGPAMNAFIAIHVHGRTVMRPAVLRTSTVPRTDPDLAHLETLFGEADYDWHEPLSSRSFQNWRHRLRRKQDFVSVVWERGDKRAYRVRTETPTGLLRSAALTLRAKDLLPTSGAFDFKKEGSVELAETEITSQPLVERSHSNVKPKSSEVPASPADTLHVLAALDRIGADVGEPVDISEDARRGTVVVRAMGLSREREEKIRRVLKPLPRTTFELGSAMAGPPSNSSGMVGAYTNSLPPALRLRFEEQMGGSTAFQEMTDRVLNASSTALARAHALQVLAQHFPPNIEATLSSTDRELLHMLRMSHIEELQRLTQQIQADLKPILAASDNMLGHRGVVAGNVATWQAGIPSLVGAVQKVDRSLNILLAGSYSQSAGEEMRRMLPVQLEVIDSCVGIQRQFIN